MATHHLPLHGSRLARQYLLYFYYTAITAYSYRAIMYRTTAAPASAASAASFLRRATLIGCIGSRWHILWGVVKDIPRDETGAFPPPPPPPTPPAPVENVHSSSKEGVGDAGGRFLDGHHQIGEDFHQVHWKRKELGKLDPLYETARAGHLLSRGEDRERASVRSRGPPRGRWACAGHPPRSSWWRARRP
jgi:hypothetical protein